jgi:hypothetical protein
MQRGVALVEIERMLISNVVVCDNGRCRAVDSATTQQAAEPETAPTVAEQPATPAPVTVADGSRND